MTNIQIGNPYKFAIPCLVVFLLVLLTCSYSNMILMQASDAYSQSDKLINQGQYSKAVKMLKKSIDVHPSYSLNHLQIGRAYMKQGNYFEADAELHCAIQLEQDLTPAFYELGNLYVLTGKFVSARENWIKGRDMHDGVWSVLCDNMIKRL